ncbi:MAG: amidohydrolase [Armatimonadota bacterium]|nr:amidohydrolase [Armatimonadota bacterium]MDR7448282.1 amidohydrolase [Armatimonadota bacterium]MDR7458312.1 amidohydrolase [Armatimonadota bacterium]MDR7478385.1 amidohydrolase [Armatimonadota bacterium]MDR7487319.1 amidohydrolase [Armatimonadota bacterium]
MARLLIRDADVVLTVDPQDRVLTAHSIVVEDGRIAALGPTEEIDRRYGETPFDEVIPGRGRLVMPGLVDAHLHFSEQLVRGVFVDTLSTRPWVFNWAKPVYAAMRAEDEYVATLLAGIEMIKTGTTCALDMGAQSDVGAVVRALERVGVRAVTGRHAADRLPERLPPHWTPEMVERHFFPSAEAALGELERCVRQYHGSGGGRIRVWVNIEGKEPCSPELHAGAPALARRLGVGTTYHIASSIEEAQASERRTGKWPVTLLHEWGALQDNLVLAHVVAVRSEEIAYLAEAGTKVAFCPGTALKLAKGATRIGKYPEMLQAGITVALGCDGPSAAGSLDMMRQMYLAAGLFKDARMDPTLIGARQALRMATIDGARALLWDDEIGSVEVGKRADLVLFTLEACDWVPYGDPIQTLVYSASVSSVHTVIIDGRVVMRDRRVLTVDEHEVYALAREHARRVVERAGIRPGVTPTVSTAYD